MKNYKCKLTLVFTEENESGIPSQREEEYSVRIEGYDQNNAEGKLFRAIDDNEIPELQNKFFDELYFSVEEVIDKREEVRVAN